MQPSLRASSAAAFLAGLPVLLAFHVWHWFNIAPVWNVLFEGLVGVALAALAIGWAWSLSRRAGRFGSRWGGLAIGGVFAGALVVSLAMGLARGDRPDPTAAAGIAAALPPVLVAVAVVAVAGWRIAGGWRGALAYGLAGLVLLLYLGGSVVQRGGVGLGRELFLVLAPSYLLAGVILGVLEPRLRAWGGRGQAQRNNA